MSRIAVENRFGSLSTFNYPADSYDSTKLGLGSLLKQYAGAGNEDKYVGPPQIGFSRPVESVNAFSGIYPWATQWSPTIDWVFLADNAAGAATRRIQFLTYNRVTGVLACVGYVTLSYPYLNTQGVYVIRGFRMTYDKYTVGAASASGVNVSSTGSPAWQTARLAVGSRIGFGSKDPSLIDPSKWYEISSITGEGTIVLTADAGTISSGDYVIEDLRAITVCTNATTAANGGVFVAKGLRIEQFQSAGGTVPAATTTDNTRANYWIKDNAANSNNTAFGIGLMDRTDWQNHNLFVGDGTANPYLFKYNLRAALSSITTGGSVNAFVWKTGQGGAVTGAIAQTNNGRIAITNHAPGLGLTCMYFTTASRIYRTIDLTGNLSASTTWLADSIPEIPPGNVGTFAVTGSLGALEYSDYLDRFYVTTGGRCYLTQYTTAGPPQWERIMFADNKQLAQVAADTSGLTPFPELLAAFTIWTNQGILYLAGTGTTAILNFVYAIPMAVDWEYAATTNQRCILPKMLTPNASSYVRAYLNTQQVMGARTGKNLGLPPEPVRMYCRTTGIDDNSGSWGQPLDYSGDISTIPAGSAIQFMLEWRAIGPFCIPGKVFSVAVTYEDLSTDSHYQPSVANSDKTDKRFAWRFSTAFGGTVPRLRIRLYDAVNGGGPLVDDDTTSHPLLWQKSTNGGTGWDAYNAEDKANDLTYIRYTPASLGDNIRVRALLTLY